MLLMKWLEIIELRAVHIDQHELQQQIAHLLDEVKNENAIRIYVNVRVETDWSVHVQHDSEKAEAHGSKVGRRLKEILKESGLVNHSIWFEQY
jgi:hypothetical protein